MASKQVVTYTCDGCGKEPSDDLEVESHMVTVDRVTYEVDACTKCWTKASTPMEKILMKGRKVPRAVVLQRLR